MRKKAHAVTPGRWQRRRRGGEQETSRQRGAPAEGLTRWYELPQDLTAGPLGVRVPPRRLGIRYIHARRLIKYSFAASGTTRSVGRFFARSSVLFQPLSCRASILPFLPSSLPFSLLLPRILEHLSRYFRVRSLLAITPTQLQIAVPSITLSINARTWKTKNEKSVRSKKEKRSFCVRLYLKECRAKICRRSYTFECIWETVASRSSNKEENTLGILRPPFFRLKILRMFFTIRPFFCPTKQCLYYSGLNIVMKNANLN